jgi:hypothetical protein
LSFKKEWVKKILGKKQMMSGNKMLQYWDSRTSYKWIEYPNSSLKNC